jgi:hypothetical protein
VTFGGAVGGTTPLTKLQTKGLGITAINGGSIKTTGKQEYDDVVTLGANTAITIAATNTVTFSSTIDGAFSLSVETLSGLVQFGGSIGSTTPLVSLTTGNTTRVEIFGESLGESIATTGAQTYNDDVTINKDTLIQSTVAGDINFMKDVSGLDNLIVNTAGTTTFGSPGSLLASVTTDAPGATVIAGNMQTTGAQTYKDSITLGGNATVTGTTVTFDGKITGGNNSLAVVGNAVFGDAAADSVTGVTDLSVTGTTTINTDTITTSKTQTYSDNVTLGANVAVITLKSLGPGLSGNINFKAKIDGPASLILNTAGTTTFGGDVGIGTFLAGLTTDVGGTTQIDGGHIAAAVQTYNDAVVLGANTTFNATGSITFNGTVDGAFDLQSFDTGATTFNGTVGGMTPLVNLILNADGSTHINADITTTGNHSYLNQVFVQNVVTHLVTLKGNFVQFGNFSSLNGAVAGESLTIIAAAGVPFNGVVGNAQPLKNLTVTANDGAVSAAGNITLTGDLKFSATETVVPTTNNVTIAAGIVVQAANIRLEAGDSILVSGNLSATAGTMKIDLASLDNVGVTDIAAAGTTTTGSLIAVTGKLSGLTITITGSSQDDDVNLNLAGVTSANPVTINAGAGDLSRAANIRRHGVVAAGRPYFQPGINSVAGNIDDQVTLDDIAFVPAVSTAVVKYAISGNQILRDGVAKVTYASIEQFGLKTGANHNDIVVNMGAGLPNMLQLDGGGGSDNRFQVIGTAAADDISIGDNPSTLIVGGVPLHAQFELKNLNRMWIQGLGGNDTIDNISHVPALLDGGAGNDVINNIVDDPNSKFTLNAKKIAQSTPQQVSLVLGNLGSDKLFTGAGIRDNSQPANPLNTALKDFSDTGITFLMGDHQATKVGGVYKFSQVADANNVAIKDSYFSSSGALRHGFVSIGKDNAAQGIFAYGAGNSVKFSNTISWLKAQIFVQAGLTNLITALAKQISFYEDDVKPGVGEAPPDEPDTSGNIPALSAAIDVDRDGEITPLDALLIINDLNSRGSHAAPPLPLDDSGDDSLSAALNFDIDQDGEVAPIDSLLVINALNLLSDNANDVVNAVAADVASATASESSNTVVSTPSQPTFTSQDLILLLSASNSQSQQRRTI